MLEPYDGKLSRTVLRGAGAGNGPRLTRCAWRMKQVHQVCDSSSSVSGIKKIGALYLAEWYKPCSPTRPGMTASTKITSEKRGNSRRIIGEEVYRSLLANEFYFSGHQPKELSARPSDVVAQRKIRQKSTT